MHRGEFNYLNFDPTDKKMDQSLNVRIRSFFSFII